MKAKLDVNMYLNIGHGDGEILCYIPKDFPKNLISFPFDFILLEDLQIGFF